MKLDLEFRGEQPEGWTPLEAVVVVKCIDDAGVVRIYSRSTESLNAWEESGMLLWSLDSGRRQLQDCTEEGDP